MARSCTALSLSFINLYTTFFVRNRTAWNSSSIINASPCCISIPAIAITSPPFLYFVRSSFFPGRLHVHNTSHQGAEGKQEKEKHNLCLSVWLWCKTCIAAKMEGKMRKEICVLGCYKLWDVWKIPGAGEEWYSGLACRETRPSMPFLLIILRFHLRLLSSGEEKKLYPSEIHIPTFYFFLFFGGGIIWDFQMRQEWGGTGAWRRNWRVHVIHGVDVWWIISFYFPCIPLWGRCLKQQEFW